MRRTLFLVPREDVPVVQAAVSARVAATLRRQLVAKVTRNGTRPQVDGDVEGWLRDLEGRVEEAVVERGSATGAELSSDVPGLRTAILPRTPSEGPQAVTSPLLTIMSAAGRIVRGTPTGAWTNRQHRWEPVDHWWPGGLSALDVGQARVGLAHAYLARFGPATADDVTWWTGWSKTITREALEQLPTEEVDLDGEIGLVLRDDDLDDLDHLDDGPESPVATLLPALDPTPMGWKQRGWLLGIDRRHLFDRAGNIGPTLWWDGEVIGSWAVMPGGDIRTAVLADRGADAGRAIEAAAALVHSRLDGASVTPAARTPLEQSLSPASPA